MKSSRAVEYHRPELREKCCKGGILGLVGTVQLYLIHIELAHNYKNLNNFRQE